MLHVVCVRRIAMLCTRFAIACWLLIRHQGRRVVGCVVRVLPLEALPRWILPLRLFLLTVTEAGAGVLALLKQKAADLPQAKRRRSQGQDHTALKDRDKQISWTPWWWPQVAPNPGRSWSRRARRRPRRARGAKAKGGSRVAAGAQRQGTS